MKMELIAALIHRPKVLFLDEPTIGLDVVSQRAVRLFLRDYNRRHRVTIILTSHYMADIKELCERVIVIHKGSKIYDGAAGHARVGLRQQEEDRPLRAEGREPSPSRGARGTARPPRGRRHLHAARLKPTISSPSPRRCSRREPSPT
jgi:ABC-type multidrug transport system ATPase subunit